MSAVKTLLTFLDLVILIGMEIVWKKGFPEKCGNGFLVFN